VQQLVRTGQRILDAEFGLQNADRILAAQTTDAVIPFRRTGLESFEEDRLPIGRKLGRRTATRLRGQRGDASVAVGIRPTLHEPPTACQAILNGLRLQPFENQQNDPVSIALLGVPLNPRQTAHRRPISR